MPDTLDAPAVMSDQPVPATGQSAPEPVPVEDEQPAGTAPCDPCAAPAPTLVSATVTFKTNNDDKHRNSYVSVTVRDALNAIVAEVSDTFDEFKDNRQYGPYDMHVLNPTPKQLVRPGGSLTLYFGQDANDEWHSNVLVDLAFSDGSHIATEEQDLSFTGDKPKKVFGI